MAASCGVLLGEGSQPYLTPKRSRTCEDVAVLGPDEAPLHQGSHGHVPAGRAAEGRVAGALAPQLVQREGVRAVPPHQSHHEVRVAPVLRWGWGTPVKPLSVLSWPQLG